MLWVLGHELSHRDVQCDPSRGAASIGPHYHSQRGAAQRLRGLWAGKLLYYNTTILHYYILLVYHIE